MRKIIKTAILLFFLLALSASKTSASDGTFELRSTNQYDYRCFAASLQLQNANYRVIVSCRNILYPVDGTIFSYVLWANPVNGGAPVRLGEIGLGKAEYATKVAFASLFITTEKNSKVKEPTGEVVMRGSVKPIIFLENPSQTTQDTTTQDTDETENGEKKVTPSPEPAATSTRDKLVTGLKRAGLASGLALVAILGLVFVLTRPK